ncbi:MAG TPA: hypothetical protein VGS41_04845, partial [Chthonomonadales bacterium]|nr:hypothetical protein [Chthonomonadales bacterium]
MHSLNAAMAALRLLFHAQNEDREDTNPAIARVFYGRAESAETGANRLARRGGLSIEPPAAFLCSPQAGAITWRGAGEPLPRDLPILA